MKKLTDMTACNTVVFKETAEKIVAKCNHTFVKDNAEAIRQAEKLFKAKGFKAYTLCIRKEDPNEKIMIEFDTGGKSSFEQYFIIIIGRHVVDIYGGTVRPMLVQDYLYNVDKINNRAKCIISKEGTTHYIIEDPTIKDPYQYLRLGKLNI